LILNSSLFLTYSNGHTNVVLCDGTKRYPVEIAFPSEWTLVTAVYNPSGATAADNFYVYTNGSNKETALYKVNCVLDDTDTHLVLGHDTTSGSVSSRPFEITQLAFYYKILSHAQSMNSDATSGEWLIITLANNAVKCLRMRKKLK